MPITANDFTTKVADYKYFVVDIISNEILAEVPFTDVSFERALKGAGSFQGSIAIAADTKNLELYANTMPGKTAVYVVRNGYCVWGGIIWARDYSITERSLQISAAEFTSYLHHRNIWKTYNYSLEAKAWKPTTGDVKIELVTRKQVFPLTDTAGNRTKVYVSFTEQGFIKYSGFYEITSLISPNAEDGFYVSIPSLPTRAGTYYPKVTISSRVDTYQYIRELIQEVFTDFIDTEFTNELIAPGVISAYTVTYRSVTDNVATIETDSAHGLVPGQRVKLMNVDSITAGTYVVISVPETTSFTFAHTSSNVTRNVSALTAASYPIESRYSTSVAAKAVKNIKRLHTDTFATVTTTVPHGFSVGDLVILALEAKYATYNKSGAALTILTVPSATKFTYSYADGSHSSFTGASGINVANSTVNYSVKKPILELATIGTNTFAVDDYVYVSGVDDPAWGVPMYDGYKKVYATPAYSSPNRYFQYEPEFDMTVEPDNKATITKAYYYHPNRLVKLTLAQTHRFLPGDRIYVNGNISVVAGSQTVYSVSGNTLTYKPSTAGTATIKEQTYNATAQRTRGIVGAVEYDFKTITFKKRVGTTATITTSAAHGFIEGDYVIVNCDDTSFNNGNTQVLITDVPSTTSFSYYSSGTTYATNTAATGSAYFTYTNFGVAMYPTAASSTGVNRTVTIAGHGLTVGTWVTVYIAGDAKFGNNNKPVQIASTTTDTFTYTFTGATSYSVTISSVGSTSVVTRAAYASKTPTIYVRSYGEFPENADMGGMEFSTSNYSQKAFINAPIRGGELINVGEHLDKYANSINGFDYRVDCSVDTSSGVGRFKKTFVLVPRQPVSLKEYLDANPLDDGEYAPPSAFGADRLTFEYPGNVSDVTLQENAENGVTRMFVTGDGGGSGSDDASPRYSAASATDLLAAGWPLLDGTEKQDWPLVGYDKINTDNWGNYDVEGDLNKSAQRFLAESKPPMGEYSIKINGSLDPVVGSYNPGDWCQLVINDDFISERLNSELEPRNDVILRKVESIKVSVPNSPAFPEDITLNLVPEWEIDTHG